MITGQGVDPDDVGKLLEPALVSPSGPLPANAAADQALVAAANSILNQPTTSPTSLPDVAGHVSGRRWLIDANPLGLASVQLSFPSPTEGGLDARFTNETPELKAAIGLDGGDRTLQDRDGLLLGLRGSSASDGHACISSVSGDQRPCDRA